MKNKVNIKILIKISMLFLTILISFTTYINAEVTKPQITNELKTTEKIINKNLDTIISYPKKFPNPYYYINMHKIEYEEILSFSDEALPYLYSIYQNDKGLRGQISKIAMFEINPDLNIKSEDSPGKFNSSYLIETYGIDFENPISGLYPAKEIRLIDTISGKTLWNMAPGYLKTDFAWSQDGKYVAISYMARIYGETIILDTSNMKLIPFPQVDEISKKIDKKYAPKEIRSDPYIWLFKWNDDSNLQVSFNWVSKDDKDVEGYFTFDLKTNEIKDIYADFAASPSPLDFKNPDKVEIKYNYFNYFDENYKPYVTNDKNIIKLLTDMLQNSTVINKLQYEDLKRPNNSIANIVLYYGKEKKEMEYVIDALYNKSAFYLNGIYYSSDYNVARLIDKFNEIRPETVKINEKAKALLNGFKLTPAFLISTADVKLPDNLFYKQGEFPIKLYFAHNLQLSKDIGLDFNNYLGKNLKIEKYYLIDPLPKVFYPQVDAYAIILWDKDKIVGAYMDAGRAGFSCSLSQNTFESITKLYFNTWYAENYFDRKDEKNIENSKLSSEEVVKKYFEALNKGDNSHFQYESIEKLRSYLYINMDNRKIFLSSFYEGMPEDLKNNIESVKLLSIEKSPEEAQENKIIYKIKIDQKFKKEITTSNGIDYLNIELIKEGQFGWKIVGMGH